MASLFPLPQMYVYDDQVHHVRVFASLSIVAVITTVSTYRTLSWTEYHVYCCLCSGFLNLNFFFLFIKQWVKVKLDDAAHRCILLFQQNFECYLLLSSVIIRPLYLSFLQIILHSWTTKQIPLLHAAFFSMLFAK